MLSHFLPAIRLLKRMTAEKSFVKYKDMIVTFVMMAYLENGRLHQILLETW